MTCQQMDLDIAVAYNVIVANIIFRKRDEHLITFKIGPNASQIDFFLMKRIDKLTEGSGTAENVCGSERTCEGRNHGFSKKFIQTALW